jgi:hypothetical protein
VIVKALPSAAAGPGSFNYTVPAGVTRLQALVAGAGGGGGGMDASAPGIGGQAHWSPQHSRSPPGRC